MRRPFLRQKPKQDNLIRDPKLRCQRREQVAAAACELFIRDGFHATGIRDIARQAGVSPGAVLTYFRSKEEILFYIFDREQGRAEQQLAALMAQLRQQLVAGADAREVLAQVLETFVRAIDAIGRFTLLAYQETKSLRPEWREELFARERRIQDLFVEVLQYGVRQGVFAPECLAVKAHSIVVLAHAWVVRRWALKEIPTVDAYVEMLKSLVLGMLTCGGGTTAGEPGSLVCP